MLFLSYPFIVWIFSIAITRIIHLYIFNNANNFKASIGMDDQQLTNLEELLVFAYKLGYNHGEDFMDGKRPEDTPLPFYQDQYSEYGGD